MNYWKEGSGIMELLGVQVSHNVVLQLGRRGVWKGDGGCKRSNQGLWNLSDV